MLVELPRIRIDLINNVDRAGARIRAKEHINLIAIAANRALYIAIGSGHADLPTRAIRRCSAASRSLGILDGDIQALNVQVPFFIVACVLLCLGRLCDLRCCNGHILGDLDLDGRAACAIAGWKRNACLALLSRNHLVTTIDCLLRRHSFDGCVRFLHARRDCRRLLRSDKAFARNSTVWRLLLHDSGRTSGLTRSRSRDQAKQRLRVDALRQRHANEISNGLVGRNKDSTLAVCILDDLRTSGLVQGVSNAIHEIGIALDIGEVGAGEIDAATFATRHGVDLGGNVGDRFRARLIGLGRLDGRCRSDLFRGDGDTTVARCCNFFRALFRPKVGNVFLGHLCLAEDGEVFWGNDGTYRRISGSGGDRLCRLGNIRGDWHWRCSRCVRTGLIRLCDRRSGQSTETSRQRSGRFGAHLPCGARLRHGHGKASDSFHDGFSRLCLTRRRQFAKILADAFADSFECNRSTKALCTFGNRIAQLDGVILSLLDSHDDGVVGKPSASHRINGCLGDILEHLIFGKSFAGCQSFGLGHLDRRRGCCNIDSTISKCFCGRLFYGTRRRTEPPFRRSKHDHINRRDHAALDGPFLNRICALGIGERPVLGALLRLPACFQNRVAAEQSNQEACRRSDRTEERADTCSGQGWRHRSHAIGCLLHDKFKNAFRVIDGSRSDILDATPDRVAVLRLLRLDLGVEFGECGRVVLLHILGISGGLHDTIGVARVGSGRSLDGASRLLRASRKGFPETGEEAFRLHISGDRRTAEHFPRLSIGGWRSRSGRSRLIDRRAAEHLPRRTFTA